MMGVSEKLLVRWEISEDDPHPHCPHGPMLLFYRKNEGEDMGYFACSAHRDRRHCISDLSKKSITPAELKKRYKLPIRKYKQCREILLRAGDDTQRHYCCSCQVPFLDNDLSLHVDHEVVRNLNKDQLFDPTRFLNPAEDNKLQAQYFFDEKSLKFFLKCFLDLGITKVVCIGAPRLHAYLRRMSKFVESFLLDFDFRFFYFFTDDHFALYNMCNNYFFDEQQEKYFKSFLKCESSQRVLIFTDPPFGCRTEIISQTLRQLIILHNEINGLPHQPLSIFWVYPYFYEQRIREEMPEMEMCDYQVNYTNHESFTDVGEKRRKLGSPVRVFTNVPLHLLHLPNEEELYKYCAKCQRHTALNNHHCSKCRVCPSKNGATYKHCYRCGLCVKPKYTHCHDCRRCVDMTEHNCEVFQRHQRCWICLQEGHIEFRCEAWNRRRRMDTQTKVKISKNVITCLLCGKQGHNERNCKRRRKYIEDITFLGEKSVKFKIE